MWDLLCYFADQHSVEQDISCCHIAVNLHQKQLQTVNTKAPSWIYHNNITCGLKEMVSHHSSGGNVLHSLGHFCTERELDGGASFFALGTNVFMQRPVVTIWEHQHYRHISRSCDDPNQGQYVSMFKQRLDNKNIAIFKPHKYSRFIVHWEQVNTYHWFQQTLCASSSCSVLSIARLARLLPANDNLLTC